MGKKYEVSVYDLSSRMELVHRYTTRGHNIRAVMDRILRKSCGRSYQDAKVLHAKCPGGRCIAFKDPKTERMLKIVVREVRTERRIGLSA